MRIVLAPDSYKDALCAHDAAAAMATGVRRAIPDAKLVVCPMGDGGEGTLDALLAATGAQRREANAHDALGRPIRAAWGWQQESHTAYIELAETSGLQALTRDERTARYSTTVGVGELICEALDAGAEHLLLMLGGSATNDGGAGMLTALGARLLDARGQPLPPGGAALAELADLDLSGLDPRLQHLVVETAVDVDNPLTGERGASAVFGPQKGAAYQDVKSLDAALGHFADHVARALGKDHRHVPGTGAAGGMGFAAHAILASSLRPGIELVMEQVGFERILSDADLVITGEGQLDGQSLSGKTPIGIARAAKRHDVPVVILAGCLGSGWQAAYEEGVTAAFALADRPMELEAALKACAGQLADRAEAVARLVSAWTSN
ncbi:glycerate kinase [Halomonas sp. BC04]|uniref:glycerate kinase n=1 Tax=Halomonas sp. BC04 TaxID=1403540 RepID=UPI0003ED706F|nr:glycerate kinase [Halomonas sp. BC04]EWH02593.1 glycerate kinase [Halomonas sp. BC04]